MPTRATATAVRPTAVRSPGRPTTPPIAAAARRAGTTTAAAGAAFGVVASGAFAAIIPATLDGHATEANAATDAPATMLASESTPLAAAAPKAADGSSTGYFSPVSFADTSSIGMPKANTDVASVDKAGKIAEKIAGEHARAALADQQKQAARGKLDSVIEKGGLNGWIAEALDHMGMSQSYASGLKKIILKESNGNPKAVNDWDSNALAGNPSEGLMQVIPSTFEKYVHPDFSDRSITDPVANITAGVRYMIDRYGMDTLAQGGRTGSSGGYLGY